MKVEPNAEMRTFAVTLRQMYVALIDEGFTKDEALRIIAEVMRTGMGRGQ